MKPNRGATALHKLLFLTALLTMCCIVYAGPVAQLLPVFANAETVTVLGYSGPMQDPVVSADGTVLFFDSHNDGNLPSNLYWAKRLNYKSIQFMGPVGGVNQFTGTSQMTLRGNYDRNGNFCFAYDNSLTQPNGVYIACGKWNNGTVSGLSRVSGISSPTNITFDVYISPDGKTLLSDFVKLSTAMMPERSTLFVASRNNDGSFTQKPDSNTVLSTLHSIPGRPLVYNAALTPDALVIFFTAAPSQPSFVEHPKTYMATRATISQPFGAPMPVDSVDNPGDGCPGDFSEVGGVSPDGKYLYFHRYTGRTTDLLCVVTRQ